MSGDSRWMAAPLLALSMIVVLVLIGFALTGHPYQTLDRLQMWMWPQRFTVEDWKSHPDQCHLMAADLAASKKLRGKSVVQLRRMLGEPDDYIRDFSISWDASSPQRPDDELVVFLKGDRVVGWSLTHDPENGREYR